MKNTVIISNASRALHKIGFKLKKHSPEILVTAGVIGTVASAVMACKATTKLDAILAESKEKVDQIHEFAEREDKEVEYTQEDATKDVALVYTQTGLKIAKLYAPAVILGALSITGIVASHKILSKRNVALAAAYATVDTGFKEYRNRVIERFGKELDRELKYNLKSKEIEETVVNEDGTESVVKKTVTVADFNTESDYSKFFDEYCVGWTKDPELNLTFLKGQEAWANKKLQAQGYLFLNDVYEMLGIPRTKQGQVVGWTYDPRETYPTADKRDGYVSFGIYDLHDPQKRDFVNGRERSILLDFNVDGNILDKI